MKYQLVTTNGKTIEKSELILNEGDRLVITVNSLNKNYPPSVEQVLKWHNHFKEVFERSDTVVTKPTFIEFSILKVEQ